MPFGRILTWQRAVKNLILKNGWIPADRVGEQIAWFYNQLGIDDVYFELETTSVIADHITSMFAAKVAAASRKDKREEIRLDMEERDHAIYIDTSEPGKSAVGGPRFETRLESKYLDGNLTDRFRIETFRSSGSLGGNSDSKASLRCYFVYQCDFVEPNADPSETRLEVISDRMFLAKATDNTKVCKPVTICTPFFPDRPPAGGSCPKLDGNTADLEVANVSRDNRGCRQPNRPCH